MTLWGSPGWLWVSFLSHLGNIWGCKMVPKPIKIAIHNLNIFWTTFWSGFGTLRPSKVSIWLGRSFKHLIFTFFSFYVFWGQFWHQKGSILASKSLQKSIQKNNTCLKHFGGCFAPPRTGDNNGGLWGCFAGPGGDTGGETPWGNVPTAMPPGKQGSADIFPPPI